MERTRPMQPEVDQTLSPEIGFKPQNEQVINSAIQEFMKTPMTRRKFLTVALGTAAMALAGCGEKDDGLVDSADESSTKVRPAFTPNFDLKTTPTPESTATPTEVLPTATSTPEPTATFTPEPTATFTPEPTATSTPTPEATKVPEWDGKMKLEVGSLSPELTGFERLELNPLYINNSFEGYENLNAEQAAELLGLYGHMYAEAVANNGIGDRPTLKKSEINALSVDDFKKRLMDDPESCKYKVSAHTPDNLRVSERPQLLEVDPRKGIDYKILIDSNMLRETNQDLLGNVATMNNGMEYRYIVAEDGRLSIVLVMDEAILESSFAQERLEENKPLFYAYRVCGYPLDLMRYDKKMRGEDFTMPDEEEWNFMRYDNLLQAPVTDSSLPDGNSIVRDLDHMSGTNPIVYPLFKI